MRIMRRPMDDWSLCHSTSSGIEYAEINCARAIAYLLDNEKQKRLERGECRYCFYWRSSRIGGASMTEWLCGICAEHQLHSSTATPRLCAQCGKKHELCIECGGDLHQRIRRKWKDIDVKPTPKEFLP